MVAAISVALKAAGCTSCTGSVQPSAAIGTAVYHDNFNHSKSGLQLLYVKTLKKQIVPLRETMGTNANLVIQVSWSSWTDREKRLPAIAIPECKFCRFERAENTPILLSRDVAVKEKAHAFTRFDFILQTKFGL